MNQRQGTRARLGPTSHPHCPVSTTSASALAGARPAGPEGCRCGCRRRSRTASCDAAPRFIDPASTIAALLHFETRLQPNVAPGSDGSRPTSTASQRQATGAGHSPCVRSCSSGEALRPGGLAAAVRLPLPSRYRNGSTGMTPPDLYRHRLCAFTGGPRQAGSAKRAGRFSVAGDL